LYNTYPRRRYSEGFEIFLFRVTECLTQAQKTVQRVNNESSKPVVLVYPDTTLRVWVGLTPAVWPSATGQHRTGLRAMQA